MKKSTLFLFAFFLFGSTVVKSQMFIGGNISLSTSGGTNLTESETTDLTSYTDLEFGPKIGFFTSDKFALGIELIVGTDRERDVITTGPNDVIVKDINNYFTFSPFARYYFFNKNKFSIFGQGTLGISIGSNKIKTDGNVNEGPRFTSFGIGVMPGMSFNLTDKIALEAGINLLDLGWNVSIVKDSYDDGTGTGNEIDTRDIRSNTYFNASLDNMLNTGAISISAIFKL